MLLSGAASFLTLASTIIVHAAPLVSLDSNHSTSLLFERGLERNPCSLSSLCVQKLDGAATALEKGFYYKDQLQDPRWLKVNEAYATYQEEFTEAVWLTHGPLVKGHLEITLNLAAEPSYYTSTGQPVEAEAEGALISMLESKIARLLLIRETIARQSRKKAQIKELSKDIKELSATWTEMAVIGYNLPSANAMRPSADRYQAYMRLWFDNIDPKFVFYYHDIEPLTDEQAEKEAYIQAKAAEYLEPEMYGTRDYKLLEDLDLELCSMVRVGKHSLSSKELWLAGLRAPLPGQIYGSDRYARNHEIFRIISRRHAAHKSWTAGAIEAYTYDPDTGEAGPGRINVLEAEFSRKMVLLKLRNNESSIAAKVYGLVAVISLLEAWATAVKARKFVPGQVPSLGTTSAPRNSEIWASSVSLMAETWRALEVKNVDLEDEFTMVLGRQDNTLMLWESLGQSRAKLEGLIKPNLTSESTLTNRWSTYVLKCY